MAAPSIQLTEATQRSLQQALALATESAHSQATPAHLASALLTPPAGTPGTTLFASILNKAGASPDAVQRGLSKYLVRLPSQEPPPDNVELSPGLNKVLRDAQKLMKDQNDSFVAQDHLVLSLMADPTVGGVVKEAGATVDAVKKAAQAVRAGKQVNSKGAEDSFEALSKYARDLTADAESGKLDPVIGRDNEVRRTIRILSRRTKNNAVLIGPPGVGKTAIAEALAQRIVDRDVPVNLLGKLFSLDMGALAAGASYKGQYEERVKSVIDEIEKSETNIILFIDEMHLLLAGKDSSGGMDAANLLKPALARGKIRCVGATTLDEYSKYIEKDPALERRFQQVIVNEPSVPETISILRGIKEKYEVHHGVQILDAALITAATLAHRYLTSRKLPDAAIDLVDEAAAAVRVARDSQPEEIDTLQRAKLQLEIELTALSREVERNKKDEVSKAKLADVKTRISAIDDQLAPLRARFEAEKSRSEEVQRIREKLDQMQNKANDAERRYDLDTAADLRHYAIPDLRAKLEEVEQAKREQDIAAAESGGAMAGDVVTVDAIQQIIANWTGIPVQSLKSTEKEKLLKIEKVLRKAVVGQEEAIKVVSNAIRLNRSGLGNQDRPIASFLFAGPSGTGKTLLTKELARFLFDSPDAMIRIDGSEYSEKHTISRLIGSPPGYIGHDEGGVLTDYIRRKPYAVVLVDEVEKASREFCQLFLQVLDDGRLTDSKGRVVNFKNALIVFTSNLGSSYLNELPDDTTSVPEGTKELVQAAIRAHFAPEFINRIDSIVIYNRLSRQDVRKIVEVRIAEVQKRLKTNGRDVKLQFSDASLDWLASVGFNPAYGARPLARTLQSEVLNQLSRLLIDGSIRDGEAARIDLDARANRIVILPNHESTMQVDDDESDDEMDEDEIKIEEVDD